MQPSPLCMSYKDLLQNQTDLVGTFSIKQTLALGDPHFYLKRQVFHRKEFPIRRKWNFWQKKKRWLYPCVYPAAVRASRDDNATASWAQIPDEKLGLARAVRASHLATEVPRVGMIFLFHPVALELFFTRFLVKSVHSRSSFARTARSIASLGGQLTGPCRTPQPRMSTPRAPHCSQPNCRTTFASAPSTALQV